MPTAVRQILACLSLCLCLVLAACQRAPAPPAGDGTAAAPPTRGESFELTWQGALPCADCAGIDTRLVLRRGPAGQRYALEETYLGADADNRFVQEGDWVEEAAEIAGRTVTVYRLDPQGSGRWFWLQPDGGLEMLDGPGRPAANPMAYRLQRM